MGPSRFACACPGTPARSAAGRPSRERVSHPPLVVGEPPLIRKVQYGHLLFLLHRLPFDRQNPAVLRVLAIDDAAGYRAELRLGGGGGHSPKDIIGDFDGDGNLEVLNLELLTPAMKKFLPALAGGVCIRSIYRLILNGPQFMRVKGRAFERQFMEHARELIDQHYPEALKEERSRPWAEGIVMCWLATVDSTGSPALIRDALARLERLPYPDAARKRELRRLLAQDGYPLLEDPKR